MTDAKPDAADTESAAPKRKWVNPRRLLLLILLLVVLPFGLFLLFGKAVYGDDRHRAQASEAIQLASGAKTPLAEYYADKGQWPKSLDELQLPIRGKYTESIVITRGAGSTAPELELTLTMRTQDVSRRVSGKTARLWTQDGGKAWQCGPITMPDDALPAACRSAQSP